MTQTTMRLAVVTGMSGAGRSTAASALEDLGWFVVENIPPMMIGQLVDLADANDALDKLAVVVDARGGAFFSELEQAVHDLHEQGRDVVVVFLEAVDAVLVRRFESSRRPHPLQGSGRILDGLAKERELLARLRGSADLVIDTSQLNVHDLRRRVEEAFPDDGGVRLRATVMSFGFKYGIPVDADVVLDARFLPNPYWVPELRDFTGLDERVNDYVLEGAEARRFLDQVTTLVDTVAGGYLREGKRYVTVAIGCTGGKHRSVAMAENLAARLVRAGVEATVLHRDLGRE